MTPGSNQLHNASGREVVRCYWPSGFYVLAFLNRLKISGGHTLASRGLHVHCQGSVWTEILLGETEPICNLGYALCELTHNHKCGTWMAWSRGVCSECAPSGLKDGGRSYHRSGNGTCSYGDLCGLPAIFYWGSTGHSVNNGTLALQQFTPTLYGVNVQQLLSLELVCNIKHTVTLIYAHTSAVKLQNQPH